jgi:tRNA threonylcarbamoyladenosine biosynthesis protein TsaE
LTYEPDDHGPVVWHFDCYRLEDPEEVWELGLEDALADGFSIMEWPERLGGLLPAHALRVIFAPHGAGRRATLEASGTWANRLTAVAQREQWRQV